MKKELKYTSPKEQIEKLKSQNLVINDEDYAEHILGAYGYSNLIKSYRDPYVYTDENGRKRYRDGTSFDQIVSLYMLDKNLRNSVMAAMLDLEEYVKVHAAHTVASSFGIHQDDYMRFRNYRDKKKKKTQFSLFEILKRMNEAIETDKDPINHYREKYGIVPPWVLFKSVYFSTIINFIDLFKTSEKDKMTEALYGNKLNLNEKEKRLLMMDTMFVANEYRNLAAHGGRIYNHHCNYHLRLTGELGEQTSRIQGITRLLFLIQLLGYQSPYIALSQSLSQEINRHCNSFPQDATYLGQILQMNIEKRDLVYVSQKSNKYHVNPHCSGMSSSAQMEKADAVARGFIPCKKCSK